MNRRAGEGGMALPLVVVLILALTALGYGALSLATSEGRGSRAAVHHLEARLAAEGAVRLLESRLLADTLPRVPPWRDESLLEGRQGMVRYGAGLRALDPEWHLVVGWARRGVDGASYGAARTLWAPDPASRVARAPAILAHGGPVRLAVGAHIGAGDLFGPEPGGTPESCSPYLESLDSLMPARRLPPAALTPEDGTLPGEPPRLGLLDAVILRERLTELPIDAVTPSPVAMAGACDEGAPNNWGSPSSPSGPCGGLRIALVRRGDLLIPGGEGQGLLVVEGSLVLRDALFAGMVLVRDSLVLGPGGRIAGLVQVGGTVRLEAGSSLDGRACAAALAVARPPGLRRPVVLAVRPWIRPFPGSLDTP